MKDEISLNYYFSSLWSKKFIILFAIIIGFVFGYIHNSLSSRHYQVNHEFDIDNVAYKIDSKLVLFNLKRIRNTEENFVKWSELTRQNVIVFKDVFHNGASNIINNPTKFQYISTEINKLKYLQLYNEYSAKILSKETTTSINDAISRAEKLNKDSGAIGQTLSSLAFTSNTSDNIKYDIIIFDKPHAPTSSTGAKNIYVIYIILFLFLTFIVVSINILNEYQKE